MQSRWDEFYIDEERERQIERTLRQNSRRWRVWRLISYLILLVGIAATTLVVIWTDGGWFEKAAAGASAILVPAALAPISMAIAKSGAGRDVILARWEEKVLLMGGELIESYKPRFTDVARARYVENRIRLDAITKIAHDRANCRYVIYGKVRKQSIDKAFSKRETDMDHIALYDYFKGGPELFELIASHSGVSIEEGPA